MSGIGAKLAASGQSRLLAGCAGFASILPELLGLERREPEAAALENRLFVICGSVNPITKKQLDRGGTGRISKILHKTGEEKLDREFWRSGAGDRRVRQITEAGNGRDCVILDTNDREGTPDTLEYARGLGMDTEAVRQRIPETLGIILKQMLDQGLTPSGWSPAGTRCWDS